MSRIRAEAADGAAGHVPGGGGRAARVQDAAGGRRAGRLPGAAPPRGAAHAPHRRHAGEAARAARGDDHR